MCLLGHGTHLLMFSPDGLWLITEGRIGGDVENGCHPRFRFFLSYGVVLPRENWAVRLELQR